MSVLVSLGGDCSTVERVSGGESGEIAGWMERERRLEKQCDS